MQLSVVTLCVLMHDGHLIHKVMLFNSVEGQRTFVALLWFLITLTTFHAKITTIYLCLSKLYQKHYRSHFSDTVYIDAVKQQTILQKMWPV